MELEKELALEKGRREHQNQRFEHQMKEFTSEQRAVAGIAQANKQMENGKRDRSVEAKRLVKDEYDMVPTRLQSATAKADGMTFSTRMEPKTAQIPAKARKVSGLSTYDPSRVKSSIPGAKSTAQAPHRAKKNQ